jgi:MoaA/NifB/PqqE/SkfB family radical SAM enzyme
MVQGIRPGDRWRQTLDSHLAIAGFAIVCVTQENLFAPWIHFEAGAISQTLRGRVCPYLFGIQSVAEPFASFQYVHADRLGTQGLVLALNDALEQPEDRAIVLKRFERLWQDLECRLHAIPSQSPYPIGGDQPFEGFLNQVPPQALDRFHARARERFDILGHTLSKLLEKGRGLSSLLTALHNGAVVRAIYLDPTAGHSDQIAQITARIEQPFEEKIYTSLRTAKAIKRDLPNILREWRTQLSMNQCRQIAARFKPAASSLISYHHIQRVDDIMLVSEYSQSDQPGHAAPTREWHKHRSPERFTFYEAEFERIWQSARPVEEVLSESGIQIDRRRILAQLPVVQEIHRSVHSEGALSLPPPRMLVAFPSMECNQHCDNCYTYASKTMSKDMMTEELLGKIVQQAQGMDVSCLEFSGGGEPLCHPMIDKFLAAAVAAPNRQFKVGILTNGARILDQPEVRRAVVGLDYVRLGYTEELDAKGNDDAFYAALDSLTAEKIDRRAFVRIGAKFLLTNENADRVAKRVQQILEKKLADHIKIKSLRSEDGGAEPTDPVVRNFEHQIADLRERYDARDIQVDVKSARVNVNTHRCWINPIMSVIDAVGDVYLCCNFYERRDELRIGSLRRDGTGEYAEFWDKTRHRAIMARIPVDRVCNSHKGVDCRLVHAQRISEPIVRSLDARQLSQKLEMNSLFPSHRCLV